MKFFVIYQITNLLNNNIYIGAHETHRLDDGYMSSSKLVSAAIKKHGLCNFTKTILYYCCNTTEMYEKERELVNEEFVKRKDTYNIKVGGIGGWGHYHGTKKHKESCKKAGQSRKHDMPVGKKFEKNSIRTRAASEKGNIAKRKLMEDNNYRNNVISKISEYQKHNNSMAGKCWIFPIDSTNHNTDKRVCRLDSIPYGWIRSSDKRELEKRRIGNYGKHWITNEKLKLNKLHDGDDIPSGWAKGRNPSYYKPYEK